jgi:hypothetical protein
MTVATGTRYTASGDGSTTAFTPAFSVNAADELGVVLQLDSDLSLTVQTLNTDYTVTLDADTNIPTVTFTTAPASGYTVLLYPDADFEQQDDIANSATFLGSNVEAMVDKVARQVQTLEDRIKACIRVPITDPAGVNELAAPVGRKDFYLFFNATTGQPELKAIATIQAELGTLDADLAAIAALSPANDDIIQRKAGAWVNRTMTQLAADFGGLLPDTLAFAADTNTNITRPGTDQMRFSTGGNEAMTIDADQQILQPNQVGFLAYVNASGISNVTGDGTAYTVVFNAEVHDIGADFNTSTGVHTAPKEGYYDYSGAVKLSAVGSATEVLVELVTTNRTYELYRQAGGAVDVSTVLTIPWSVTNAKMETSETASVRVTVTGEGGDTSDILGSGTDMLTWFAGRLVG